MVAGSSRRAASDDGIPSNIDAQFTVNPALESPEAVQDLPEELFMLYSTKSRRQIEASRSQTAFGRLQNTVARHLGNAHNQHKKGSGVEQGTYCSRQ